MKINLEELHFEEKDWKTGEEKTQYVMCMVIFRSVRLSVIRKTTRQLLCVCQNMAGGQDCTSCAEIHCKYLGSWL